MTNPVLDDALREAMSNWSGYLPAVQSVHDDLKAIYAAGIAEVARLERSIGHLNQQLAQAARELETGRALCGNAANALLDARRLVLEEVRARIADRHGIHSAVIGTINRMMEEDPQPVAAP